MKKAFCMLILVAWSCVFPPEPLAQQPELDRGTVEGPSRNPVAEAAVKLVSQMNGETRKTATDESGNCGNTW